MPGDIRALIIATLALLAPIPAASATGAEAAATPEAALAELRHEAGGALDAHLAPETGAYDFVRATGGSVLARDDRRGRPLERAVRFLRRHGAVAGIGEDERASLGTKNGVLRFERVTRDLAGKTHVRFAQRYRGLEVFGAELVVHMDAKGVTGFSGQFVPGVRVGTVPKLARDRAVRAAITVVDKTKGDASARGATLAVFRVGLLEGRPGRNALAWDVRVAVSEGDLEQVWVDATNGGVLLRIPLIPGARDRRVYSPEYDRSNPDMFEWRREGEPDTNVPPWDNLYRFTGQVYDFFSKSFGRDSFDAGGATMRTVYLINDHCPNAYWNGSSTNYCPAFDADDVVAHEWGHAYTEHTQGLIYFCQSGALNESYSDIWGETIDLLNGEDGIGGSNNDRPYPDGQRWLVGEDLGKQAQELLLRDMWDPKRLGDPGKVSDPEYVCGTGDGGGVHTNSGVPNHAYAMLVDGKKYNGVTIPAIGLTKAAHIYYQAMTHYQTRTSKFSVHEHALKASCEDLTGINLRELSTGAPSGKIIGAADCAAVAAATKAVQMANPGKQCNFQPMFVRADGLCPGATVHFGETFEDGLAGWTLGSEGVNPEWPEFKWAAATKAPQGHPGRAAFALNSSDGSCERGDDISGRFWMDSPRISIPSSVSNVKLRFKHYMASEYAYDGGHLSISVNGGEFELVPASAYRFNGPNATLLTAPPSPAGGSNKNPNAGRRAWTGANGGDTVGSWGTTVADLAGIANPGDAIVLRFEFGNDCGGGWFGWYVDDLQVYSCPILPAPEVTINGGSPTQEATSYSVAWTRPKDATGPDTVQESTASCVPLIFDTAESGIGNWDLETKGDNAQSWESANDKPQHEGAVFRVRGVPGIKNASSAMTWKHPIPIGSGATTLTFSDWHLNEGDDQVRVEVSVNGTSWDTVYNTGRSDYAPVALVAYASEPMTSQSVDLSKYAGKTVRLRFRYVLGPDDRPASVPFGWYVDDVKIMTELWSTIAKVAGTSLAIPGRAQSGLYCYRVATSYRINGRLVQGDFSGPATVKVKGSKVAVKGERKTRLPATGVPDGMLPAVTLLAAATAAGRIARKRRQT